MRHPHLPILVVSSVTIALVGCETAVEPDVDAPLAADATQSASSWSELAAGPGIAALRAQLEGIDTSPAPTQITASQSSGSRLTFYGSKADLRGNISRDLAMRLENFENEITPFPIFGGPPCPGPFNIKTDDECYLPGEIQPEIAVDNKNRSGAGAELGMIVIKEGLFTPSTVVGPNSFFDHTIIRVPAFSKEGVEVLAFEVWTPLGACNMEIDFFGTGGFLGTLAFVTSGFDFVAALTDGSVVIRRAVLRSAEDVCGELIDNVLFAG